jgi:hypothetical protein
VVSEYGGVEFEHCIVVDDENRSFLSAEEPEGSAGCANVKGTVTVVSPFTARFDLGSQSHAISLSLQPDKAAVAVAAGAAASAEAAGVGIPAQALLPTATAPPRTVGSATCVAYPNPVNHGWLYFKFTPLYPETVLIRLFNLAGELAFSQTADISQAFPVVACSVQDLATGLYIYLIREGGGWLKGKICVLHDSRH